MVCQECKGKGRVKGFNNDNILYEEIPDFIWVDCLECGGNGN